ncbi:MAG: hypothetical protein ACE5J3_03030, partial [Methanosarcinales archaeon]
MSEKSSKHYEYDLDKIADAMEFAKITNSELLETLINSFIMEKDPEYRYTKYQAIVKGTERLKKVW